MTTLLRLKAGLFDRPIPVDAASLSPDRTAGLAARAIADLPLLVGCRTERTGDLFDIEEAGSEDLVIEGDLASFSRLGAGMTRGRLTLRGNAGPRAGSGMSGGILHIEGDAAAHAGEGMRGGALLVDGSAGDHLGAPLAGHAHGVNRGAILVRGGAGAMAGFRMRRGTIVIAGDAGPGAGTAMLAGSLFVFGSLGIGAGALMRRGTILTTRPHDPASVFPESGLSRFSYLALYYDALEAAGIVLPAGARHAAYRRHVGDLSGAGRGEILVMEPSS
ncbi:MAG TPA: formylmethanofuran dehydrogenase subunit C [Candidatus Cryosericum sp.]|nr:formylmethanofuran dehydrogenase subunit C [Candidatus Cryosericum sp.]